jgi:hypothetical protein
MSLDLVAALHDGITPVDDHWDGSRLHISDLGKMLPGEGCRRQVKLRLQGAAQRDPSLGQMLLFDHGHRIHERLTEVLRRGLPSGWTIIGVEERTSIEHRGHLITGSCDLQLANERDEYLIVDYKTKRGRAFSYLTEARPANVLQVQGYLCAEDADHGILLYVDREGQNEAVQFHVERDDAAVYRAADTLVELVESEELPPVLEPAIKLQERKGPDAVYMDLPWQCSYCPYMGVSCPGAEVPCSGLVGHWDGADFKPKEGMDAAGPIVRRALPVLPERAA